MSMSAATYLLVSHLRQMSVHREVNGTLQITDLSAGHCRTSQILPPRPWYHVPGTPRSINADSGIFACWTDPALSCSAQWHDLASHFGFDIYVHCPAPGSQQARQRLAHFTTKILRTRLHGWCSILLPTWSPLPRFEFLQRNHMVCTS